MRKFLIIILLLLIMITPVRAMEITAPEAPADAEALFPEERTTFAQDLWQILCNAMDDVSPAITKSLRVCASVLSATVLLSLISGMTGHHAKATDIVGTILLSTLLMDASNTLIRLGTDTIRQLSEYGKLLIPVMTGALAAQGGTTTSAAICAGTVLFDAVLSNMISIILIPMIYIYLCLSVANSAIGDGILDKIRKFIKWSMTWVLKIIMYIFTGYIGITGVVSGTVDSAAVKATKLTLSGVVPVVGSILSDASEAVLVSAGIMKNAAGVYGILALFAIAVGPFIRIGVQYLLLKITATLGSTIGTSRTSSLINDFSSAMGMVLAMTGASGLMLMISTVCFMKGVG